MSYIEHVDDFYIMKGNQNVPESESDFSELDFSGPVPKFKSSRLSDVDNISILSSISQRVHTYKSEPQRKLIPGSMSIYDRDESEKNQTNELNLFFLDLHNQTIEQEKREAEMKEKEKDIRSQVNGSAAAQKIVNVSSLVRRHRRPDNISETSTEPRRHLPNQPINISGHSMTPPSALTFGNISSKQINTQKSDELKVLSRDNSITLLPTKSTVDQSQSNTPARKASLPVTERVEEEFSDIDNSNDFPQYRPGVNSRRQSNPLRSQSTVPGSASSKEILQRLQRNAGRTTPVSNELRYRIRTQTSSDVIKSPSNSTFKSSSNSEIVTTKTSSRVRPTSSIGESTQLSKSSIRKIPPVLERSGSSFNTSEAFPVSQVRKESSRPKSSRDNSSSKSESSEHSKPNFFFEYGHM